MIDRRRTLLVLGGLLVLVGTAGCLSPVSDEQLAENATYNWGRDANASYQVYAGNYTAVLKLDNQTELELFDRDGFGSKQALPISSLQFRYPNGTVVNDSAYEISTSQSMVTIEPPDPNGTVAFTAPRNGPRFHTRVLVEGTHEVRLPPGREVTIPIISKVVPGNYSTETVENQVVIHWTEVDRDTLSVKFYRGRDVLLFGGMASIVLLIGAVGFVYYRREISKLESQREDLGLDVDSEDDDPRDRGPPPGMR